MPTAAPPRTEYKIVPLSRVGLKAASPGTRELTGYASRWDDVDFMGDTVRRGAFGQTLKARATRPLLWDHDPGTPIGVEIELVEDSQGLRGTWKLSRTTAADDAYTLLKDGAVSGLSIGFVPVETRPNSSGGRDILAADLLEISVCSIPALDSARVLDVKSAGGGTDIMSVAARLAARGVTPLPGIDRRSFGTRVVESEEVKAFTAGRRAEARVSLADVSVKALVSGRIGQAAAGADTLLADQQLPGFLALLPHFPSPGGIAQVPRLTTATNNAAPVGDATATTGSSGTKAESAYAWANDRLTCEIVAHTLPVSRRVIEDSSSLQAVLEGELLGGLADAAEDVALNGTGTTPQIRGILQCPGIGSVTGDPLAPFAGIAEARGVVETQGRRRADTLAIASDAWGALAQAAPGLVGTDPTGRSTFWGLAVAVCPSLASGSAVVLHAGSCPVFDAQTASVELGWINDQFTRNLVELLAELSFCVGVTRPLAVCSVTGLVAP